MAKVKAATTIGCASRDHSDSLLIGLAKLPRGLSCQYGLVNAPTPAAPMAELPLATAVMGWVPVRRLCAMNSRHLVNAKPAFPETGPNLELWFQVGPAVPGTLKSPSKQMVRQSPMRHFKILNLERLRFIISNMAPQDGGWRRAERVASCSQLVYSSLEIHARVELLIRGSAVVWCRFISRGGK
jgi:hypothetical protein